jgi:DNA-binding MarR family transcriptional regulator
MIRPNVTRQAWAVETARRQVLAQVARRGPVPLAELATAWPHTRHQTRLVVRDLSRDGLVAFARRLEDRAPVLALTADGRRALGVAGTS